MLLNQYQNVKLLFGAAYAAPNNSKTILNNFKLILVSIQMITSLKKIVKFKKCSRP